jgi:hypothetical protein
MVIASASPWSNICFKSWTTVWACASGCIWNHPSAILCFGCGGRSGFSEVVFAGEIAVLIKGVILSLFFLISTKLTEKNYLS